MSPTVNSGKPAWFELADNDALSADVRKVDKKLPAVAVLVTGALLATGAFLANGSLLNADSAQANSVSTTSLKTVTAANTTSPVTSANVAGKTPKAKAAPTVIKNPMQAGIPAPTGHGEDGENNREDD